MPEITSITPQKKDKSRVNIAIDGRFFCGMKLETVMQNRLKAGMAITPEELSRMQFESEKLTAFDKALTHISHSMKTEKEMRDFLRGKGYLEEIISFVIDKMKGYGYLDDREYAARYYESVKSRKGARLIALELRRKGVGDEEIASALEEPEGEEESAKAVLEKYLRGKDPSDPKTYRKAYSHLLSKGFDGDTVRDVLRDVLKGAHDEDDPT